MPGQRAGRAQIEWVRIDDFSPGVFDGSNISIESPHLLAPLGGASRDNTFCCSSIEGGALGPLPMLTSDLPFSTLGGGLPGASTLALLTAIIVTPQLNVDGYEIVSVFESDDGTSHYQRAYSYVPQIASLNAITGPTQTYASSPGFFGSPYPAFTRMALAANLGTLPPPAPRLVFPGPGPAGAVEGSLWVYPGMLAPTSFAAQDLITHGTPPSSIAGQVVCYGNRVICLVGVNYPWPAGTGINVNENFNYTDPPESSTYLDQQSIMAVETPWGYGAWGTVSVGELLLVKKHGGAVILNGDINTPSSIIRVPGVQPTGDIVGRAAPTPIGLIYCSENLGAWIWNGGNTSSKISKNIADNFFDLETGVILSNNYGFNVEPWQKWVLFSNNMMLDTETNGWWKLFPNHGTNVPHLPNGRNLWWYNGLPFTNQMSASPLTVTGNSDPFFSIFDNTVPSQAYQWESLPIGASPHDDRVLDVRQVAIQLSDPTNTGGAAVELTVNGNVIATSSDTITSDPVTIRFNVGVEGVDNITIRLNCFNTVNGGSAPIVHSIDIGYVIRASGGVND